MQEYDLKIAMADGLRSLCSENYLMQAILAKMHQFTEELSALFAQAPEPKLMERYLYEMTRCSKLFRHQLKGVEHTFDRFMLNLKHNSPMEGFLCTSEDEIVEEEEDDVLEEGGTRDGFRETRGAQEGVKLTVSRPGSPAKKKKKIGKIVTQRKKGKRN